MVIGIAIFLNIVAAALAGIFLPVILDKYKNAPTLSGLVF
ncbi:MAG: magnesium transporter [Paraglaciecola sp.]|jgi:magnesium transporter